MLTGEIQQKFQYIHTQRPEYSKLWFSYINLVTLITSLCTVIHVDFKSKIDTLNKLACVYFYFDC